MKTILLLSLLALAGCGTINSAINAYGYVAVEDVKAANDTTIRAWKVAACATPYSAIQRNPDIKPTIKVLCGEL